MLFQEEKKQELSNNLFIYLKRLLKKKKKNKNKKIKIVF